MTASKITLSAQYSKEEHQELLFLYKYFNIESLPTSSALRKLHHAMYSLLTQQQEPSGSSRREEQVGLLEGWDCPCRFPIWRYHKPSKEWHRKVLCSNPTTQQILRTTELDAEVCKRCYDTGGSANLPALPEPKKQVLTPTPKAQQVQRLCEICKIDISKQPSNHTLCRNCWFKQLKGAKAPGDVGHGEGLPGSSMQIGKQQAARLRDLDERMKQKQQSKEE